MTLMGQPDSHIFLFSLVRAREGLAFGLENRLGEAIGFLDFVSRGLETLGIFVHIWNVSDLQPMSSPIGQNKFARGSGGLA